MKTNKKGFTVVELIVTFVLVMSLSVGLFAVVDSYREKQQKEAILKELNSYKNEVLKIVQEDFLNNVIYSIEGADARVCDDENSKFNQAVILRYRKKIIDPVYFCVGEEGIKYNGILYKKPLGDFVTFTNDIIYNESEKITVEGPGDNMDETKGPTIATKKFLSINVKMKHSEIEEPIEINIRGLSSKI